MSTTRLHESAGVRRTFPVLDMLRGIAAILVVTRHNRNLWWWFVLPENHLAVDLFFVMSGVVIAHSYQDRLLNRASVRQFIKIRLVRLYPLYLVGISIGLLVLYHRGVGDDYHHFSHETAVLAAIVSAALMLPVIGFPILDFPRWSLTFELAANIAYAMTIRFLTIPTLITIVAVSAFGLLALVVTNGSVDAGYRFPLIWGGVPRVCYSFFMGVIIHRVSHLRASLSPFAACGLTATATVVLCIPWVGRATIPYELATVLVVFPLLVLAAIHIEVGPRVQRVFAFFGATSYAIYITHAPLGNLFSDAIGALGISTARPPVVLSLVYLALVVGLAWLLDRFYDIPVRRWLSRRVGPLLPACVPEVATTTVAA